jgi:hypothetical protein
VSVEFNPLQFALDYSQYWLFSAYFPVIFILGTPYPKVKKMSIFLKVRPVFGQLAAPQTNHARIWLWRRPHQPSDSSPGRKVLPHPAVA